MWMSFEIIIPYTPNSWFSLWEKNTQNEYIIAHFEFFFYLSLYSKTVWLTESLSKVTFSYYEKIFSNIKQTFYHFEKGLEIKNIDLSHWDYHYFLPRYMALKLNQKIITKISNSLTWNTFFIHPGNLLLKEIAFNKFTTLKLKGQIIEHSCFKDSCLEFINITE